MPEIETVQGRQGDATPVAAEGAEQPGIGSYVGTVALVGLGVAFIEEELLAGMAIGVAAMAFPNLVPRLSGALRPLLKTAVRAGYGVAAKTRETVAEMSEQFQDVVAEVRAEREHAETGGAHGGSDERAAQGPRPTAQASGRADTDHARPRRAARSSMGAGESPE